MWVLWRLACLPDRESSVAMGPRMDAVCGDAFDVKLRQISSGASLLETCFLPVVANKLDAVIADVLCFWMTVLIMLTVIWILSPQVPLLMA